MLKLSLQQNELQQPLDKYREELGVEGFARLCEYRELMPNESIDILVRAVKQEFRNKAVIAKMVEENQKQRDLENLRGYCFHKYCRLHDYFIPSDELFLDIMIIFNKSSDPESLLNMSVDEILRKYKVLS